MGVLYPKGDSRDMHILTTASIPLQAREGPASVHAIQQHNHCLAAGGGARESTVSVLLSS